MLVANVNTAVGPNKGNRPLFPIVTDGTGLRTSTPHRGLHPDQVQAELQPHIGRRVCYVDTIQFWTPRPLPAAVRNKVLRLCGSLRMLHGPMRYQPRWKFGYVFHQPTPAALELLDKTFGADVLVNGLHVALDLVTDTKLAAQDVEAFLQTHWTVRKTPTDETSFYATTTYGRRKRWAANNFAMYADRDCKKLFRSPCCHVEWRMAQAATLRKAGIHRVGDVAGFDHVAFWQARLDLRYVDVEALGRLHRFHHGRKRRGARLAKPDHKGRQTNLDALQGRWLARKAMRSRKTKHEHPDSWRPVRPLFAVQSLKEFCPYDISRGLRRIDAGWLLPAPDKYSLLNLPHLTPCSTTNSLKPSKPCIKPQFTQKHPDRIRSVQQVPVTPNKQAQSTLGSDNLDQFVRALQVLTQTAQGTRTPYPISSPVAGTRPVRSREGRAALRCGNGMGGRAPP